MRLVFFELVHEHHRTREGDMLLAVQFKVDCQVLRALFLMAFFDAKACDQNLLVQDLVDPKFLTIEDYLLSEITKPFRHGQAPKIA